MRSAYAAAVFALRSENGAIPPGVWQPAHLVAKIGATWAQVGAPERAAGPAFREPAAIAATTAATAATATSTSAILRCTSQKLPAKGPLVKRP
jgi:hypothetical protein